MNREIDILKEFLNLPIDSANSVFEKFQEDKAGKLLDIDGEKVYFKLGNRKDKILLIAHADTVWDKRHYNYVTSTKLNNNYKTDFELDLEDIPTTKPLSNYLQENVSTFYSNNNINGIGADDRAGAAIVYLLKDTGNSVLITDNEEIGAIASRKLMQNPKLRDLIKSHRYILQFDLKGTKNFKCYNAGSDDFKVMLETKTKYSMLPNFSYTDVAFLGKDICGANFSIGYYNEHTPNEYLVKDEWLETYKVAEKLATGLHQQFYTDPEFGNRTTQKAANDEIIINFDK